MNLVIGSTGSIGSAVVDELSSLRRPVRALVRDPNKAKRIFRHAEQIDLVQGSAENLQLLKTAFDGVKVVFNCLNLPYPEWSGLPAIHKQILRYAAKHSQRRWFFLESCTS